MGLELHALNLIKFVGRHRALGAVATIGRQTLALAPAVRATEQIAADEQYCELMLLRMGASEVDSYDVSDYEQATHVADFNRPLAPEKKYDTVFDFGSLEHIFDQKQAFENVRALAAEDAIVCHVLPVNNLAGHGLWQFCSDLLHEVYSAANGFADTKVFYASAMQFDYWYEAPSPQAGLRTQIASLEPVILLAISRRTADAAEPLKVMQTFYTEAWGTAEGAAKRRPTMRTRIKHRLNRLREGAPDLYLTIRNVATIGALATRRGSLAMSARRSAFSRHSVIDLVARGFGGG